MVQRVPGEGGVVALLSLPPGLGTLTTGCPSARVSQKPQACSEGVVSPSHPYIGGRTSLHDALAAFAPPHHQRGHQQGDEDRQQDEGAEDAVGRVMQRPARGRAVPEVLLVHGHEELIHQSVGPVAVEPLGDQRRAVRQLPVGAEKHRQRQRGGIRDQQWDMSMPPCITETLSYRKKSIGYVYIIIKIDYWFLSITVYM